MTEGFYTRAVAFHLRADAASDGLTLEGYAAVFNSPTLINDWDGEYEETIAPGAFKRTINARTPVLQFDHGQHPVLGSIPIGSIESLGEDARGLLVRARLFDNWMTEPVRQAIEAKAIDGMSFRFQVVQDQRTEPKNPGELRTRLLKEVRLFELGPVVFPAYSDTSVSLRSLAQVVPGLTLSLTDGDAPVEERAEETAQPDTSDEPAAESRGTSDEPVTTDDPAPSHSSPSTHAERLQKARLIRFDRRDKLITSADEVRTSKLVEMRTRLDEIDAELLLLAETETLTESQEERDSDLWAERTEVKAEHDKLEARAARADEIRGKTYREIKGVPEVRSPVAETLGKDIRTLETKVARDAALRVLESRDNGYVLAPNQVDAVERHIRKNDDIARRILVTENDAYRSAFHKLMQDNNAAVYFDDEERVAMRRYYEYRAASEGTTTAGGFAIPVLIDPSVILTDQETDNPFLSISRVIDVNTNVWKGVSAAGMSWSFDAEAAEVSDDMVTLAQPSVTVYTARGFIPYSLEIGQDWPGFQDEMARLLAIGYDELLVEQLTRGSGSAEPYGIRTYLETTSAAQVTSTTDGAFGQEDVYGTWAALGQKYRRRASWLMSVDMMNRVRQLGTSTNFHAYSVNIEAGALPLLFNRPVYESPYMPSFSSTTGAATRLIVGDFSNYVVARRAGMTVELVPHLTSTGSNLPQGRRGWFAWARIGGAPVNASAFKIQLNT